MEEKKNCAFMGYPFSDGSEVCIPYQCPDKCIVCSDGEWRDKRLQGNRFLA